MSRALDPREGRLGRMKRKKGNGVKAGALATCPKDIGAGLTEQDLQGVRMQLQVLRLLLYHIHVLCVLAVEAVDTGIGQHLGEPPQYIQPEFGTSTSLPHFWVLHPSPTQPPQRFLLPFLPLPLLQPFEPARGPGRHLAGR